MTISFELRVGPSRGLKMVSCAVHLLVAFALAELWTALPASMLPLAAAFTLLAVFLSFKSLRKIFDSQLQGILAVDSKGSASWHGSGQACILKAWCRIGPLVWIQAEVAGARMNLMLGRDCYSDNDWRALNVWLCWLQRESGAQTA